jgi:hypothetical protein
MRKSAIFLLVLAIACEDKDPVEVNDPWVVLSADSVGIFVGETKKLTAVVVGSTDAVEFISRDSAVAQVDAGGTITGIHPGKTFVVGQLSGTTVRDSAVVTVGSTGLVRLPVLGTRFVPERYTAEIAVAGSYAYTSTWSFRIAIGNAIKIWNVAGNVPVLVDSLILSGAGTVSDVQISSDGALLVASTEGSGTPVGNNNGIAIFNRGAPQKPVLIKRYTTTAISQGVHTVKLGHVNNRHYAFLSVNPNFGERAKLAIVDITDPFNPVEVLVREMGKPFIHDVFIRDGLLFAALWNDGMTIFDVGGGNRGGSPSNPVAMGTVKTAACSTCFAGTSSVHNVWWFHDPTNGSKRYAFIGEEGPANLGGWRRASGDIHVVDVSNLDAPTEVAVYRPDSTTTWSGEGSGAHNFAMDEQSAVLYAAYYNAGVRALDVRGDLSDCTPEQKTADGRCDLRLMGREIGIALSDHDVVRFVWGVALDGNNLYASDMPNGIHKVNIAPLKR